MSNGGSKPVVTLFEQYGAGARTIGEAVANRMGLPFHAQAFSSEDLEGVGADAQLNRNATLVRVMSTLGGAYGGFEGRDIVTTQEQVHALVEDNNRAVWDEADEGGVIVGRNGALILSKRNNTKHVLLLGAVEDRIARAAQEDGIGPDVARRRQELEDEVRVKMSERLYGWTPTDPQRYDLVIDTSKVGKDEAVEQIVNLLGS